jgi:putative transposase
LEVQIARAEAAESSERRHGRADPAHGPENPLWGAERIRGELLKLGIPVAKRTIQKYLRAVSARSPSGQSWSTFLKTHGQDIWACDFVPVVTIFFKTLYAFVIVHLESRRVVHVNVTDHPSDAWVAQQLREATPFGVTPKHLIRDNDKKYRSEFDHVAKTCGIDVIHTPYQAPLANSICERFIGSLRRECLDHMLVLGRHQLVRVLIAYVDYFNQSRPHQGIAQQIPESRPSPVPTATTRAIVTFQTSCAKPVQRTAGKVITFPVLNGLHHSYAWAT